MGLQQRRTLHRKHKKVVSKRELSQVLSQEQSRISHRGQQITEKWLQQIDAEISQEVVNTSIPCTTTDGSYNVPLFDTDRLDGKMSPLFPNMLLGKITEIENHYARVVTKFGEVQWLISPTTLSLCSATNLTFDYFKEISFTFSL